MIYGGDSGRCLAVQAQAELRGLTKIVLTELGVPLVYACHCVACFAAELLQAQLHSQVLALRRAEGGTQKAVWLETSHKLGGQASVGLPAQVTSGC